MRVTILMNINGLLTMKLRLKIYKCTLYEFSEKSTSKWLFIQR